MFNLGLIINFVYVGYKNLKLSLSMLRTFISLLLVELSFAISQLVTNWLFSLCESGVISIAKQSSCLLSWTDYYRQLGKGFPYRSFRIGRQMDLYSSCGSILRIYSQYFSNLSVFSHSVDPNEIFSPSSKGSNPISLRLIIDDYFSIKQYLKKASP